MVRTKQQCFRNQDVSQENLKVLKYIQTVQAHFVDYYDNFPNTSPMYAFSSDMTSRPYEDNFQLDSVAKQKNLGGRNEAGKFDAF